MKKRVIYYNSYTQHGRAYNVQAHKSNQITITNTAAIYAICYGDGTIRNMVSVYTIHDTRGMHRVTRTTHSRNDGLRELRNMMD